MNRRHVLGLLGAGAVKALHGLSIPKIKDVQVIATGHPSGTLRTPPVVIGPEGDTPGERWLILSQADGPTTMKLRAFPLVPVQATPTDGKLPWR